MNPNQLAPDEQRALEQTTSPRTVSSAGLSAENVAEREAFLQLGQLLERAAGDFDEQAFLRKLQSGMPEVAPAVVVKPVVTPRVRRGNETWIAISIAVVAVVGVSVWLLRGDVKTVIPDPPAVKEHVPAIVQQAPVQQAPVQPTPSSPAIVRIPAVVPIGNWTDPLDERIAEMREQFRDVARPYLMDAPLRMISEQVRELQEELDAGTL